MIQMLLDQTKETPARCLGFVFLKLTVLLSKRFKDLVELYRLFHFVAWFDFG